MLHVHRRLGHTLQLGTGSVTAVDPWRRRIAVKLPPRKPRTSHAHAVSAAASHGGQVARTGAASVGAVSMAVVTATRRAAPPLRQFALWFGARTTYALAFVVWLYAVTVFTITRAAARLLLAVLRIVARVSMWVGPRVTRSARTTARRALHHLNTDVDRESLYG
jgi:hypothetical protein